MDGVYQPKYYLFFSIFYKINEINMKGFHMIKAIFLEYKTLSLNDNLDIFNINSMLIASNANNIELNIQM